MMRNLIAFWLFAWIACVPGHASLEGRWSGVARCGSWLWDWRVDEATLDIRADGNGFIGRLSIGRSLVEKRILILPEPDGRWRFKAQETGLWLDVAEDAPMIDPSRPHLAYLSITLRTPCSTLHLVKGHEAWPETKSFHHGCARVLDILSRAAEAEDIARRLKQDKPDLLQNYDPARARLAVLAEADGFGARSAESQSRLLLHMADCGKFHPAGSQIEELSEFAIRRIADRRVRRKFWSRGPVFDVTLDPAGLARVSRAQSEIRARLQSDLALLRDTNDDALPDLETMVRERSDALSDLPLNAVVHYIASIEERLTVLRASRHLAEEFGLETLPRLPGPESGAEETVKPLDEDQIDALNARRVRKF